MSWETPPLGPTRRGPRPTTDLGHQALLSTEASFDTYSVLSEEEVEVMNYAGYLRHNPEKQATPMDSPSDTQEASPAEKTPKETIADMVKRTTYIVSRTPLHQSDCSPSKRLTTEAF